MQRAELRHIISTPSESYVSELLTRAEDSERSAWMPHLGVDILLQ